MFSVSLISVACMSLFSIYLLLDSCEIYKVFTYEDLVKETIRNKFKHPKFKYTGTRIAASIIFVQTLASISSYFTILKTLVPELLKFLLMKNPNHQCLENSDDVWFFKA